MQRTVSERHSPILLNGGLAASLWKSRTLAEGQLETWEKREAEFPVSAAGDQGQEHADELQYASALTKAVMRRFTALENWTISAHLCQQTRRNLMKK